MKYFYLYCVLFKKKELDYGVFSTGINILAGNTEENVENVLNWVCEERGLNPANILKYFVKQIPDTFLEAIHAEGDIRGFGNKRPKSPELPDTRSGDGKDNGNQSPV